MANGKVVVINRRTQSRCNRFYSFFRLIFHNVNLRKKSAESMSYYASRHISLAFNEKYFYLSVSLRYICTMKTLLTLLIIGGSVVFMSAEKVHSKKKARTEHPTFEQRCKPFWSRIHVKIHLSYALCWERI